MSVTDTRIVTPAAPRVSGFCPMGCGSTLVLEGSVVRCRQLDCPRPTAVFEVLGDLEEDHIVVLRTSDFLVQHPLRERLGRALLTCSVQRLLADPATPARQPGAYRVALADDGSLVWGPAVNHLFEGTGLLGTRQVHE